MRCSRCVLPFLALHLLLEEISAAVLPSKFRNRREVGWLDQEVFSHLSDSSDVDDLSVGDADRLGRNVDNHSFGSDTFLPRTEHLLAQNQYQHNRKANDKRRKVAPLDSIGGFQMSSFRNRKDEPDIYWEDYRN